MQAPLLNRDLAEAHQGSFNLNKHFPEKVIQFGTGVLLRGLTDYLIEKANRQQYFGGSVVVVKSTGVDVSEFTQQDNLYTVLDKGVKQGHVIAEKHLITCINRVLVATTEWETILQCAANPDIEIAISNTTEAGLVYVQERLTNAAPVSFPAKLTAYLWHRYQTFGGDLTKGIIILPTELVSDNGHLLKQFVLRHAEHNQLPTAFMEWIEAGNYFCNTLVDRIVPGKSEKDDLVVWNEEITYYDHLHLTAEPFLLWAIEGGTLIKEKLSFAAADNRVVIAESIAGFKEQKLRILNGSNTAVVSPAYLAGCDTVYETTQDPLFARFTVDLIEKEIIPTIIDQCPGAPDFASQVLDRFGNPFVQYKLLNIALQSSSKMNSRNAATIIRYYTLYQTYPPLMLTGLAAFFLFYTPAGKDGDSFYGERDGVRYDYRDEHAEFLCKTLQGNNWADLAGAESAISTILNNHEIFSPALPALPGITARVAELCLELKQARIRATLEKYLAKSL